MMDRSTRMKRRTKQTKKKAISKKQSPSPKMRGHEQIQHKSKPAAERQDRTHLKGFDRAPGLQKTKSIWTPISPIF